jgi:formylglycine-generating enzyme required for sulfatase activity
MSRELILRGLDFVYMEGGPVRLGTDRPLPCRLEGHRRNETPVRETRVGPFWMARCCVTNAEFERYRPQFRRPATSPRDRQPVTDVTYLEAVRYAEWLSRRMGVAFDLPTEAQWTWAAAPFGLEFPWGDQPDIARAHVRGEGVDGPLDAGDEACGRNWRGLVHAVGNVQQMVRGTAYAPGTNGAVCDGMYCITKGGDWRHCPFSAGVARRGIMDVAARVPTVGFRLVSDEQGDT